MAWIVEWIAEWTVVWTVAWRLDCQGKYLMSQKYPIKYYGFLCDKTKIITIEPRVLLGYSCGYTTCSRWLLHIKIITWNRHFAIYNYGIALAVGCDHNFRTITLQMFDFNKFYSFRGIHRNEQQFEMLK